MSLSNTAVPRYYGEFRDQVLRGEIMVNEQISLEMNRIDELIADPHYFYDEDAIEGFILFCENETTLTDGGDLHLLPIFKVWAEQVISWFYFVERSVYVPDEDGHTKLAFNSAPIVRGISGQIKNTINRNSMVQMAQSEPGSDLIQNALKLGAVTFVANYAQKNMKSSNWKKKLVGLALIYVAPIALKYAREKLEDYSRNKAAESLEKLI